MIEIIIISIIVSLVIGFLIGYLVYKQKPMDQSGSTSSLSDSLAKIIVASTNTAEYFDSSPDQLIKKISNLIEDGDLDGVEKIIQENDTSVTEVISEINNSSEVIDPDLIRDPDLIVVADIIDTQGEINQVQDEIDDQSILLNLLGSGSSSRRNIVNDKIQKLINKFNILQGKLSSKPPIANALSNISDPEKLAHLQEVQAKILTKREIQKKKREEKIKRENPDIKDNIERQIATKKVIDIENQKDKIKNDSSKSRGRR